MVLKKALKLPTAQCSSCPFLKDGLPLGAEKMSEMCSYLLKGKNHLCHSDRTHKTICYGGRQWQLDMWHRLGIIDAPTNEALAKAMKEQGVEPKQHIAGEKHGI